MGTEAPRVASRLPTGSWAGRPAGLPSGVPPPSVPLSFLAAASFGLVACGVAFLLARGSGIPDPTTDPIVAATHFGVLATLSMGVLGAMHQFTPVITGRPLRSIRLARATFLSWLAASWMLPTGIATEQVAVTAISGAFAALAITLLVVNFIGPLSVRGKGAPVTGLRFALAGSVLTACIGAAFVGDRQGNWFDLAGHVDLTMGVIGVFGWLGITYIAVAEKLWPMFFLAHVPGRHLVGRIAVWAVPIGVVLLSPGLLFGVLGLAWSGAIVLAVGLGGHLASLASYIRHRRRKADLHLLFVMTSAMWLLAGAGLSLASALVMPHDYVYGVALVTAGFVAFGGWLLTAFVGHAHKVVPFIVWAALRGRGVEKNPAGRPLLFADLYDHRWAGVSYGLVTAGISGLCVGFAASLPVAIAVGGGALAATGIIVGANLSVIPTRMLSNGAAAHAPRDGSVTGEKRENA
jgi:hypothetical protein